MLPARCSDCSGPGRCSNCDSRGVAGAVRCHCGGKAARCVRCNGTRFEVPDKTCSRCAGKGACLACSGSGRITLDQAIRRWQEKERAEFRHSNRHGGAG